MVVRITLLIILMMKTVWIRMFVRSMIWISLTTKLSKGGCFIVRSCSLGISVVSQ